MDSVGNLYLTDSENPIVYKLYPNNSFEVFATNPLFIKPPTILAGLDGIDLFNDEILLVSRLDGLLLSVNLTDPTDVNLLLNLTDFSHIDALYLAQSGVLYGAGNNLCPPGGPCGFLLSFFTTDNWASVSSYSYQNDTLPQTCGIALRNHTIPYCNHLNFGEGPGSGNPDCYIIEPFIPTPPPTVIPSPTPTSTPTSTPTVTPTPSPSGLKTWELAVIIAGAAVGVLVILGIGAFIYFRCRAGYERIN